MRRVAPAELAAPRASCVPIVAARAVAPTPALRASPPSPVGPCEIEILSPTRCRSKSRCGGLTRSDSDHARGPTPSAERRGRVPRGPAQPPSATHSAAGIGRQRERGRRGLAEVEVLAQVAQDRLALTHVGPGIGASVGLGIDALTVEEV